MKTIKSITLALVLLVGTTLFAANPIADKVNKEEASLEIAQLLKGPLFELDVDTHASVLLIINSENELVVLSVDTENEQVERYIKNRLNYKKLKNSLEIGKEYRLPVIITSET
ncbi:MAG: hypothetical protein O6943_07080 [Bacteroidetes bacterium]|nr:hypothetical protein [Bacteroidota bacterium]TDI73354.1 MAG: hypothetical protein E2O87_05370 [Bacteroidota bacterium]